MKRRATRVNAGKKLNIGQYLEDEAYRRAGEMPSCGLQTDRERLAGKIKFNLIMMAMAELDGQMPEGEEGWPSVLSEEMIAQWRAEHRR